MFGRKPKKDDIPSIEPGPVGIEALEDVPADVEPADAADSSDGAGAAEKSAAPSLASDTTQVTPPLPAHAAAGAADAQQAYAPADGSMIYMGDLDPAEQEAYAQLKRMRAQRKRRRLVKAGIAAGVVVLAIAGFFIWRAVQAGQADAERMVATEAAYRGTFTQEVNASGAIQPASSTAVAPQIDGTIESVNVVAGQHVEAGDVLFTIKNDDLDRDVNAKWRDVRSAQAAADQAWAAYSAAKKGTTTTDPETGESVYVAPDQSAINEAYGQAESAQVALEAANEAYDAAVAIAGQRSVTAPAAGNIIELNATPGSSLAQSAQSGGALCKVADLSQMKVSVQVGEVDIDKVAVGQTAKLTFSALEDVELDAQVVSVAAVSSSSGDMYGGSGGSANYAVELLVPQPDARLKPGMTASVRIITQQIDDTLVVPTLALNDMGDGTALLYVELDPDTHEMSEVTVKVDARGTSEAAVSVVSGSLADGDQVVIADSDAYGGDLGEGTYEEYYSEDGTVSGGSVAVG